MNENIKKFGYEDLKKDLELEIFGLKFEIGIDKNYLRKIKSYQDRIRNEEVNEELIEDFINSILGHNAYDKISEKYYNDRNEKIDVLTWTKVILFIKNEFDNYFNKFNKEQAKPLNRAERRNNRYNRYNKNYDRYRRY